MPYTVDFSYEFIVSFLNEDEEPTLVIQMHHSASLMFIKQWVWLPLTQGKQGALWLLISYTI